MKIEKRLPASPMIINVISRIIARCCQFQILVLDDGGLGTRGKEPIIVGLLPIIVGVVHEQ